MSVASPVRVHLDARARAVYWGLLVCVLPWVKALYMYKHNVMPSLMHQCIIKATILLECTCVWSILLGSNVNTSMQTYNICTSLLCQYLVSSKLNV